jgi:hypothetical protein
LFFHVSVDFFFFFFFILLVSSSFLKNGALEFLPGRFRLAWIGFRLVHFPRSDVAHQVEKHLRQGQTTERSFVVTRKKRIGQSNRPFINGIFLSKVGGPFGKEEKKQKYLIDMFPGFGRSLDVGHSPLLGAVLSFFQRHFPPLAKVAFISDQQE